MQAELAKLRSLPTPRWTAIVVFGLALFAFLALFVWGGDNVTDYEDTIESLVAVAGLGSMVIGVWMTGLEYGQNTLRRTLTADPRRGRLVASKLAVALGYTVVLTLGLLLLTAVLFAIAASAHGADSPASKAFEEMPAAVFVNASYALLGLGVALVTRSMAGGMTAMLAFAFAIDLILSGISGVSEWTFGVAVSDVSDAITGTEDDGSLGHALLVLFLWFGVIVGGGWARFTRGDVA